MEIKIPVTTREIKMPKLEIDELRQRLEMAEALLKETQEVIFDEAGRNTRWHKIDEYFKRKE